MAHALPCRTPWLGFPSVVLHSSISAVKGHADYPAAKAGNADAAFSLVSATLSEGAVQVLAERVAALNPLLVSVHAAEADGVNAIPEALADVLGQILDLSVERSIVQTNVVGHTGASGYARLARQALFDGDVVSGADYLLVDDFIGQGGTLANLRGFLEVRGGRVLIATVLTGKEHSATIALTDHQLETLRRKHGPLEAWWKVRFGYGFDCLTESEARYLSRAPDADTIRDRLASAE